VERKYDLRLPRKVMMVDYGDDVGDLYVRFKHAEKPQGEPTADGRVIVYYDHEDDIAAIEILDISKLQFLTQALQII